MQNIHIVYLMSRFTNSDFYSSHLTLQQSLHVSIAMHMHPSQMEATTAAKECVPQGWEQGGGCNRYLLPDCWNVLGGKCKLFLILLLRLNQKLEKNPQPEKHQPTNKKKTQQKTPSTKQNYLNRRKIVKTLVPKIYSIHWTREQSFKCHSKWRTK